MKINFMGAAHMVSGSNVLIEVGSLKFLLDCGLFQGSKEEEKLNYDFSYDPKSIDFMILSHAHIDHSGRIPKLVKEGFRGPVYSTHATKDLADIMMKDSAKIQEQDTIWENRKRERSGLDYIEPLYKVEDAENASKLFIGCHYETIIKHENISFRFKDAGHILGSSIVEIWISEGEKTSKIVFSGDLGVKGHHIIRDPEFIDGCDYLILESTYGNTIHESYGDSLDKMVSLILDTTKKGGNVVIPTFAVGRTQEIVYELNKYFENTKGIKPPIYVDSPLAYKATGVFMKNSEVFNDEAKNLISAGDNIFEFENLCYTKSVEESKALNADKMPKVIISSSGMATAGRVRHHLKHNLWNSKNTVIFVGYQAEGTLGRLLIDGVEKVKILGEEIAVKANINKLQGFSAHADSALLYEFVNMMEKKPKKIFLVHGESQEMDPFADNLKEGFGIEILKPEIGQGFDLEMLRDKEDFIPDMSKERQMLQEQLDIIVESMKKLEERNPIIDSSDYGKLTRLKSVQKDLNKNLMELNILLGK